VFNQGGFMTLLKNISRLAPNLAGLVYDQKNGVKLKPVDLALDESHFFEFEDPIENKLTPELITNLKRLDLSNNGLTRIPGFIFQLTGLSEMIFNGNFLRKIPNEMFQRPVINNESEFNELKRIQLEEEKEKRRRERAARNSEDSTSEHSDSDDENSSKKKKKNKKILKTSELTPLQIPDEVSEEKLTPLLSDHLQVLQLTDNLIEHIPENFFSSFKALTEIRLEHNPLRDPPQQSVYISGKLTRNSTSQVKTKKIKVLETVEENTISLLSNDSVVKSGGIGSGGFLKTDEKPLASFNNFGEFLLGKKIGVDETSELNLPNLFFENENLKPLQNYMVQHKKREGRLCV